MFLNRLHQPILHLVRSRPARFFTFHEIDNKRDLDIEQLRKKMNDYEFQEYEDITHDYKLELLKQTSKYARVFDSNEKLLSLRHKNERTEKNKVVYLSMISIGLGTFLMLGIIFVLDDFERLIQRSLPAYSLFIRAKKNSLLASKVNKDKEMLQIAREYIEIDKEKNLKNSACYFLLLKRMIQINDESMAQESENILIYLINCLNTQPELYMKQLIQSNEYLEVQIALKDVLGLLSSSTKETAEAKINIFKILLASVSLLDEFQKLDLALKCLSLLNSNSIKSKYLESSFSELLSESLSSFKRSRLRVSRQISSSSRPSWLSPSFSEYIAQLTKT